MAGGGGRPELERFCDWMLGIAGKGAGRAIVAAIESGTTELMQEVATLTDHAG